jgi:hypothetical protein
MPTFQKALRLKFVFINQLKKDFCFWDAADDTDCYDCNDHTPNLENIEMKIDTLLLGALQTLMKS